MSVVVPACGRTQALGRCLAALAAQQAVDGGLDVIVSVDGPDPSPSAVREVAPEGLDLQVIQSAQTGPAGARNRGAAAAARALLAFVDDDCEPADGWAAALAAALERDLDALVGGPLLNPYPRDSSAAASHAITEALYDCSTFDFLPSANLALWRDRFEALGGFDESFPTAAAEDREFCARVLGRGMRVVPVEKATVLHYRSSSPVRLWRQYAEYGRGARRLARLRESAGQPPVRAGSGFPGALARSTVRGARRARSPAVVPLVGLTQVATVWGYATCRR
jgi:GT2 family glycosyltransferase